MVFLRVPRRLNEIRWQLIFPLLLNLVIINWPAAIGNKLALVIMNRNNDSILHHAFAAVPQTKMLNGGRQDSPLFKKPMIRIQIFELKGERRINRLALVLFPFSNQLFFFDPDPPDLAGLTNLWDTFKI